MPYPPRRPSPPRMRELLRFIVGLLALIPIAVSAQEAVGPAPSGHGSYTSAHEAKSRSQTADHSKFAVLKGPFKDGDGPAVTRACLTCHTKAAEQMMATSHWTWNVAKDGKNGYGKSTALVNNYCLTIVGGNTEGCTRCHAGYGFRDKTFDFTRQENVDCLVCHDTTGDYEKERAGMPNPAVPLAEVAQKVGSPTLKNCGACHFFGGGANATKHGDLDDTILKAPRAEDVHMSKQGAGMDCVDCHTSSEHKVGGPNYVIPADRRDEPKFAGESISRMACPACHTVTPHQSYVLNRHYQKIACQTCHIPAFARGERPTNTFWDWATSGRLKEGRPYEEKDANGWPTYTSMRGKMVWERNVKPTYIWYNGNLDFMRLTDKLPAARPVVLNPAEGSYTDSKAKIWPFKFHEATQPFDPVNNTFVAPFTDGPPGTGAYWGDWKMDVAIQKGMATAGLPYSGKFDYVRTTMLWPITHMVAPKEQALACTECHTKKGRLEQVGGFYLLGRDRGTGIDVLGFSMILLTIIGVVTHGVIRSIHSRK